MGTNVAWFFHMSPSTYSVGDEIHGNGRDKVDPRIEDALEARRPNGALSRRNAVFCLEHMNFSLCGVANPGYIYRVASSGEPQRRDFAWIGEMQKALLRLKYPQYEEMNKYPEWDENLIARCCVGYWSETATTVPGWEFLTPSCTVVEVVTDELVDPKKTIAGWRSFE